MTNYMRFLAYNNILYLAIANGYIVNLVDSQYSIIVLVIHHINY